MSDVNYKYIRESLQFQELSDEEKQRRGILARLYGPCASITDATRNGRLYSDELWEKVFNENEIVQEMFHNGGICMELDHPVDREETCSEKIAAMLPEAPKRDKDGHLICYVDLIDTPCGKIAYQLAKYGFKLGISSRGTGDLITDAAGNESVDPDTYDFTTFDLVLLPAVKDARLSMCESLSPKKLNKLKKALAESYDNASTEDKRIMEDTLKDLDIELAAPSKSHIDEIPLLADEAPDLLLEDADESADGDIANPTIGDFIKELQEFDSELPIEFAPIVVDDKEYALTDLTFDDESKDKVIAKFDYVPAEEDNIDNAEEIEADEANDEAAAEEPDKKSETVDDAEVDEMLESLKEVVRQKDLLEAEVKSLKTNKTVSNAEVEKLKEDLNRYKTAFARTSEIATNAKKFEAKVASLTEQLNSKIALIEKLEAEKTNAAKLTESVDNNVAKVKTLTEKLHSANEQLETAENQLKEQATSYRKTINERTELAKKYKAKFTEVLDRYINSKASMLGIRPTEITNRLNENFSIDDIDNVCDELLTEGVNVNRLPVGSGAKMRITEARPVATKYRSLDSGYDIDDSLLELAGLK